MFDKDFITSRGLIFNGHYLPYNPKLAVKVKELRKNMTKAEKAKYIKHLMGCGEK